MPSLGWRDDVKKDLLAIGEQLYGTEISEGEILEMTSVVPILMNIDYL